MTNKLKRPAARLSVERLDDKNTRLHIAGTGEELIMYWSALTTALMRRLDLTKVEMAATLLNIPDDEIGELLDNSPGHAVVLPVDIFEGEADDDL